MSFLIGADKPVWYGCTYTVWSPDASILLGHSGVLRISSFLIGDESVILTIEHGTLVWLDKRDQTSVKHARSQGYEEK